VIVDQLSHLGADLPERLVPAYLFESIADALQRNAQAIRRMMNLVVAEPLDAGVTLAHHVVVVGLECHDPVTLDGGFEAAGRFADAAKRELGSAGHGRKGARVCGRRQAR